MSKNKGEKIKIKPKTTDSLNKMVYKKMELSCCRQGNRRKTDRKGEYREIKTDKWIREKSGASEFLALRRRPSLCFYHHSKKVTFQTLHSSTYFWLPQGDSSRKGMWLVDPGLRGVLVWICEVSWINLWLESWGGVLKLVTEELLDSLLLFPVHCWLGTGTSLPRLSIPIFNSPSFWIDL